MEIRELNQEEYTAASELLWKSFYWSEKDNVSLAGMEKFRDLTSPVSLSVNAFYESWIFCGCFEERELVAVGAAVEKTGKILMLYVHPERKKQGYGRAMLCELLGRLSGNEIVLNSSDEGVSFYRHFGFVALSERVLLDDLPVTPMKWIRK